MTIFKCDVKVRLSFTYPEGTQEWAQIQLHSFSSSAVDGGEWSSRFDRFNPAKESPLPIEMEHEWAPELGWTCIAIRMSPPVGIRTLVLVAHNEAPITTTQDFRRLPRVPTLLMGDDGTLK